MTDQTEEETCEVEEITSILAQVGSEEKKRKRGGHKRWTLPGT